MNFIEEEVHMEERLLTVKEFCEYTGLGMTKAREILKDENNTFTVRIGGRLYADKLSFNAALQKNMNKHLYF